MEKKSPISLGHLSLEFHVWYFLSDDFATTFVSNILLNMNINYTQKQRQTSIEHNSIECFWYFWELALESTSQFNFNW